MPHKSEKRLYLNADRSKIVEEDDPEASYLLVSEGGMVSDADAKQYGLKKADLKADDDDEKAKAEAKAEEAPAESKQVAAPPENKSKAAEKDK